MSKKNAAPMNFVVKRAVDDPRYMKVSDKGTIWVDDPNAAQRYPSRYASKHNSNYIAGVPDTRVIVEI